MKEPGQMAYEVMKGFSSLFSFGVWSTLDDDDKHEWATLEATIRADEAAKVRAATIDKAKAEALMDSQYRAGAQAGWNAAQSDDPEAAFANLIKSRDGCLAAIRALGGKQDG